MWRTFKTSDVQPEQAMTAWDGFVSETLIGVECSSHKARYFEGSFEQLQVNDLGLSRIISSPIQGSPIDVRLSQRFASMTPENNLLVMIQRKGAVDISHQKSDTRVEEGELFIIDPTQAYHMAVAEDIEQVVFSIDRAKAHQRGLQLADLVAKTVGLNNPSARYADNVLTALCDNGRALDGPHAYRAMHHTAEIMIDYLGEILLSDKPTPREMGARQSRLLVLAKDYIERHLPNSSLRAEDIARVLSISRRYLDTLFAAEGTTTAKYITQQRIVRSAAMLRSASHQHETITHIAYAVGFNELSYFNRQFKTRYGVTPSAFRHG